MSEKKNSNFPNLVCSFCGKSDREAKKLIAGPAVFICDECVELCNDILAEELKKEWYYRKFRQNAKTYGD